MKNPSIFLVQCIIALLLGIVLTFAFAPYEIFPLAVLAPAGLLALWTKTTSSRRAFFLGYFFGLGFFGAGVYWVFISIHVFGGASTWISFLITLGFIAFLALYPGSVGYFLVRYFPHHSKRLTYAFPALWVFSEWIRGWFLTGFPWLFLGYSQTNSPLKGYAPILGVYAISFAICISSGLIVNAVIQYRQQAYRHLYLNLFTFACIWILGGALSFIPWTQPQDKPISVSLVQGNIPQVVKWSPEHLQLSIDRYIDLTQPLWGKSNLIIWPETAIPIPLQNIEAIINELNNKAKSSGSTLILGLPIQNSTQSGYYNSVITLGEKNSVYSKRWLVPFGEYTPLTNIFSKILNIMQLPTSEMVAGQIQQKALDIYHHKILPSICYEIAFPELTRTADKKVDMLLVVTNDAWFGNSNAEPQHLQMAVMRALEFKKPILFVSNDGITAIITPDGRIAESLPPRQTAVLTSSVQPMTGLTPWLSYGFGPLFLILIFFIFISARSEKTNTKLIQASSLINE